jgi:tetratricopeptide (TPR) repeat protein
MSGRLLFIILLSFVLTSCEQLAMMTTPSKKPKPSHTQLAQEAERKFWVNLHNGAYNQLPETTKLLTAAYLENPNDPTLAAHLGFAHIWKITERARLQTIPPTITDDITLSQHYFTEAVMLDPSDARYQGFLGDSLLVSGKINQDQRQQVRGYFQLKRSIAEWPEFNYFTAGYVMSSLAPDSDEFKEGLDWQWKTLDLCANTKIDRNNPDFRPYLALETTQGPKRACWNSWIAPHNYEGFFLNMGDMLVKKGDWQTAIKIYKNAQIGKGYAHWPYRNLLEKRIQNAKENVVYFNQENEHLPDRSILFNSGYGCAACHQSQ